MEQKYDDVDGAASARGGCILSVLVVATTSVRNQTNKYSGSLLRIMTMMA